MKNFNLSTTYYTGFESEILAMRNSNRSVAQTRRYLDWRYAKLDGSPEPIVFWVKSASGESVGMASLIFRKYWMHTRPVYFGVLGDISLNPALRGKGLGQQLLEYVRHYIAQNMPDNPAFVIPNAAAQKSLTSAGWTHGGKLVSYVLPLGHLERFTRLLKHNLLIHRAQAVISKTVSLLARLQIQQGATLQLGNEPDETFGIFWSAFSKEDAILSDRGLESLLWRYASHPHIKFSFAKLMDKGDLTGYLVYTFSPLDKTLTIYDLLVMQQQDLLSMLALFLKQAMQNIGLASVRLVLNERHPYSKDLWKLGFVKREDQPTFALSWPKGVTREDTTGWFLSLGDKDI